MRFRERICSYDVLPRNFSSFEKISDASGDVFALTAPLINIVFLLKIVYT
jgi:hypothetical protein